MTTIKKNIFISHRHEDDHYLGKFKRLLAAKGYSIRDGSIDSSKPNDANNPDYIKSKILSPRIKWAGATIVIVSPDTHKSNWVNWEVQYAQKQDKPIIGVWAPKAKDSDLPEALEKYADAMVGWNAKSIIDAIEGQNHSSTTADGNTPSERPIVRIVCQ